MPRLFDVIIPACRRLHADHVFRSLWNQRFLVALTRIFLELGNAMILVNGGTQSVGKWPRPSHQGACSGRRVLCHRARHGLRNESTPPDEGTPCACVLADVGHGSGSLFRGMSDTLEKLCILVVRPAHGFSRRGTAFRPTPQRGSQRCHSRIGSRSAQAKAPKGVGLYDQAVPVIPTVGEGFSRCLHCRSLPDPNAIACHVACARTNATPPELAAATGLPKSEECFLRGSAPMSAARPSENRRKYVFGINQQQHDHQVSKHAEPIRNPPPDRPPPSAVNFGCGPHSGLVTMATATPSFRRRRTSKKSS